MAWIATGQDNEALDLAQEAIFKLVERHGACDEADMAQTAATDLLRHLSGSRTATGLPSEPLGDS